MTAIRQQAACRHGLPTRRAKACSLRHAPTAHSLGQFSFHGICFSRRHIRSKATSLGDIIAHLRGVVNRSSSFSYRPFMAPYWPLMVYYGNSRGLIGAPIFRRNQQFRSTKVEGKRGGTRATRIADSAERG